MKKPKARPASRVKVKVFREGDESPITEGTYRQAFDAVKMLLIHGDRYAILEKRDEQFDDGVIVELKEK